MTVKCFPASTVLVGNVSVEAASRGEHGTARGADVAGLFHHVGALVSKELCREPERFTTCGTLVRFFSCMYPCMSNQVGLLP